ncbi:MAG: hypothetical protein ABGW69_02145 [Nanoarchaeota archaeon]
MPPIYLGKNSIYYQKERIYAIPDRKPGITSCKEAKQIINLILRDYKRGWTYNGKGFRIPMTKELAIVRLKFLIYLANVHGAPPKEKKCIINTVNQAINIILGKKNKKQSKTTKKRKCKRKTKK